MNKEIFISAYIEAAAWADTTVREHAYAAFVLASDTAKAMICAGDLSRMELQPADILGAAVLMIEAQQVPA